MKSRMPCVNRLILPIIMMVCSYTSVSGQLSGIKNIPGDYATVAIAISSLNASTVGSGGVTFNIAANYTETISAVLSLTATGTISNPIVFQKDPATTGANPLITAYAGSSGTPSMPTQDGIFRLIGSDYVTINGIDLTDNPANTANPSTMEYGYALYMASASNGCQNVVIKNCLITLNPINNALGTAPMVDGSTGIIMMNSLATAATTPINPTAGGANSNNKFYSNTIENCNTGIALIGFAAVSPFSLADSNNDIGGNSAATGNTIINYGGAPGAINAANAIQTVAQYGLNVSYNIINNNNGGGVNHPNILRGIYTNAAASANETVSYNTITLNGGGTTHALYGIENASGSTAAGNTINISNNTVTNSTYTTATTGGFYAIRNIASPAVLAMNNNVVSNNSTAATATGFFYGILNSGTAANVTMSGNMVAGNSTAALTSGLFVGIYNSAVAANLTISSNTIAGNSTTSLSGAYYAIYNTGAVTTAISIDSNSIGNSAMSAFTFNAANSGGQLFINNIAGAITAALSVSKNDFRGITYAVAGTGPNTYISNTAATRSQAINDNTFTNLTVNTTGNISFIVNSVVVSGSGVQNVNNNSIAGTFTKSAGGTVTLFTSSAASAAGAIVNNNNNNFSNITVTGATIIAGWVNTDAGTGTKTIQNNTFSNWVAGAGAVTVMSVNLSSTNNATSGNSINNISGGSTIVGIATGAGNDKIYSNVIHTLISSGTLSTTVSGISITLGTVKNIYQNTIYDLQGNNITTGSVRGIIILGGLTANVYQNTIYSVQANALTTGYAIGIWLSGGTAVNAYRNKIYDLSSSSNAITSGIVYGFVVSGTTASANITVRSNTIGDLRTPFANAGNPVVGIGVIYSGVTSIVNVYNNTVYLATSSTGANFGSSGIYHTTSTTATTAALDLRNNIIYNASVPNGTGLTVAYRRSSATLTNYVASSNNNLFYAGIASANRLLFYDATNLDQFLSTYKARVASRDAASVTEDMISASKFISTTGSSAYFLHLDSTKATQAESGGTSIGGVTTDIDGQPIQGSAGYAGTGTAPDIGADETDGLRISTFSGTYNVGEGQTFTSLTNADGLFANINSRGLSGNVVVNITSDITEDGTNVLYQWAEQGAGSYTLTIQPDASVARVISGNVLAGMIRLNGAKRVIIDGGIGTGSNYLTFRNTNTAGTTGTAFTFINGASNNTVKYCNVEAYTNATSGVILFSTSTIAGGNSNNTISHCAINATVNSNSGNICINSAGTVGKENSTNTISNNTIYNYRDRGLDVPATGSTVWSITGNSFYNGDISGAINYPAASTLHGIRIAGGAGYSILNNYVGGNAASAGGAAANYASTLGNVSFQGIMLTTSGALPVSTIKGNTIANIALSSVPTVAGSIAFSGIETAGSGITIGGALPNDGNIIGSNAVNGSISVTTTTGTSTLTTTIRAISCNSTGGAVIGNQAGGFDIRNIGAAPAASSFLGIYVSNPTAPSQVNNNTIGAAAVANSIRVLSTSTSTATSLTGILLGIPVISTVLVDGNIVQNLSSLTTLNITGTVAGISSGAATATANITISNNTISSLLATAFSGGTGTPTSSYFVGINNTGSAGTVRINNNIIKAFSTNSATGNFNAIRNTGTVINTIQINNNQIGNSSTAAIIFNVANSATQIFINNTAGASTAALSISNNNIQGITYSAAGSSANTYILNSAATLSQAINGNIFTNLNIATTGSIIFISNSVVVPINGTQNVNGNSVAGSFTKSGAGTVTLFTSTANSLGGNVVNNSNNFSNITVSGTATIAGWVNTDAGPAAKTIQNNTFSNWTGATGTIVAMSISLTGTNNSTTGNTINNITSAGAITGIITGVGNDNIYSNVINTLSTSGNAAVIGIAVTAGATKNIYRNKIYDLQSTSTSTGTVNGILVSGTTVVAINIYNNLVGDLRTPAASATDPVRGISVTATAVNSTINVYYNTVYLNAASTGATFGSSGIYHSTSTTATTASLNLRNNSITNTSSVKGAGLTVAYRRSDATLTNYASTSNNNLFYAGTPGATKLIFYGSTISDQTMAAFRTRVATRDAQSVTENLTTKFLSTAGSSSLYLHMDAAQPTSVESGAINISGFADDFDVQVRAGNPGYTGSGTLPDIGADEVFGIEATPPTIIYTLLTDTSSATNRNIGSISITDASGINNNAGTKPRIYFKRFSDANVWLDNASSTNGWKYTEATNAGSPYTFTIDYSQLYGGAAVTAGVIQYFIVAQDLSTVSNTAINSGTFSANPASVALTAAAFPIGGTINSYKIPFSGAYDIGTGEAFTSLTKADGLFASINSAGLMGSVTFNIVSDIIEDGANALNQWTESGAGNYTITIQPDAATLRTISGNVVGGLIRLNGADRVTIDGSSGGSGPYLSFKNTNTAGTTGTAFTFINGSSGNALTNIEIGAYANTTNGVILFGTSTAAAGNSNNSIDNCTITATVSGNTGNAAIYSAGTIGKENASNTISNNIIHGYKDRGLDISANGSTAWTISGNSFYNGDVSSTFNYPASSTLHGVRVLGGSGYSILNNDIGGQGALASGGNAMYSSTLGTLSWEGILLTTSGVSSVSYVTGNIIAAISLSSVPTAPNANVFTGIETNGSGINIGGTASGEGNTIGSGISNGSISVSTSTISTANTSLITGIHCASTGGIITSNQVGGIDINNVGTAPAASSFIGLNVNSAAAPATIIGNIIGSNVRSNSIRVLSGSSALTTSLTGISIGSAVNSDILLAGNLITNLSQLSLASSGLFTGIRNNAASGIVTISNDTIQNILTGANSSANSTVYTGIFSSGGAAIADNIINNISLSSSGLNAQVMGICVSGAFASTISGNIISNLSTASTKATANAETGSPAGSAIIGILNSTTAAGQDINNNRLAAFNATSAAAVNVVVTGVGITSTGSGSIFNNRFGTMTNLATGSAPAICHIVASDGSFNVYNNTLRISNLLNTNSVKIYGIVHSSPTDWNYFHNTVRVGGNSNGAALRSAAFLLSGNSSPVLKDNIFFNIRTGTGFNYAVSNLRSTPSDWEASACDYNDYYSINSNTTTEWGSAVSKTFIEWKSLTGGDDHSISGAISFITSAYDLEPDSITNCNFNNSGIPITTPVLVSTDIYGHPRNAANPDMGAYEFNYIGFSIVVGSNSPVCAGDSLSLTVNPGNALIPSFNWSDPAGAPLSTSQSPTVALVAGQYKVVVSDSTGCEVTDSILVSISQRPTATITSVSSVCDSSFVNLNITVTGTGLISGTLSDGETFSGTAPLIIKTVFITASTSYSITDLSDSSCTAIPADFPDTVTVRVTHKGEWLGITSNWSDPVNWCEQIVPASSTNVTIPAGTSIMPVITDSVNCNSLTINAGDTLTITSSGTLNIGGTLTNYGVYLDNGTTAFNGVSGQQTFSGVTTFNNLRLNGSGLLLPVPIIVNHDLTISAGTLDANNFNIAVKGNWTNNASTSAFNGGAATVTFNSASAQTIAGAFATTFNNLTLANTTGAVTLQANANISGNLSVASGTFDLAGFTANRAGVGGALTVSNNATLKIGGTNTYPTNYTVNTLVVASTVEYSGTNQTVANQSYGNLKLSSSAGAAVKTFPATALTVGGNLSTVLGAGTSVSFTAASNITVGGNVSIGPSTTFNGSNFSHSIGGNWVNNGAFGAGSGTVTFTGPGTSVSGSGSQSFNNLTVAAPSVSFSASTVTLTGSLASTGSGSFSQASGGTFLMTGSGKTISGSGISLNNLTVTGSVSTAVSLTLTGSLSVGGSFAASSGVVTMSGASKTISGAGAIGFAVLSVSGSVTTDANFSISSGLSVNGSFSAWAGIVTFTGTSSLSGAGNLYDVVINGTSLQLATGSQLGIANTLSIVSGILDATTSVPNTVNFNGTGAQNVNGLTYSNLLLSNGGTKTAVDSITTLNDLSIGVGAIFNPSSYTHSIYGNWVNNGTFIPASSTVQFLGGATAYVDGVTSFNILTSNTSSSSTELILRSNISAAIVNMAKGVLLTGSNTITITNTRTGNGFIRGNIQRTHAFTTGVPYAFEGPDNTITFSAVSSVNSVTVSIEETSIKDFPFSSSISREYDISVPSGTYTATLRLHYEDDELNGNDESSMTLWNYEGSLWEPSGKTANSTTSNYVEQSGLTNIAKRWTCSDDANIVQWNGSVSTDWNTAANWTVLQGSGARPPSSTDIVDLGTAVFANQPAITSDVTVKNIIFGSAQALTLTLGSGGSLTTLGDISGSWTADAIHTINVNDQALTVDGNMALSDGITGHAIDLNISNGVITTSSLTETGGANINFGGAGTLNISEDFHYENGTFTAGSSVVIYDGSESQHIAHVNYNSLTINKADGIATIDSATTIAGNLLVSAGQLDNFGITTILGNVSISTGATLQNGNILRVGGNWNNSGSFIAAGVNLIFDGAGTQTISASTFNNLQINKPAGSLAVLTGDVIINGNLVGTSGILDIKSFFFNRLIVGGSATISDSSTLIIAADNAPNKFANYSLGANSTVIFNGTGTQHLLLPGIVYGNLTFRNSGLKILYTPVTVNANLTIESGSNFDGGSNTITLNGHWINSGTFTPSTSTVLFNGLSKNISGNTTFNRATITGSYTILNNVTFNSLLDITSTGSLSGGSGIQTILHGDLVNSGVLYTLGTTTFSGNVLQTLSLINSITTVALIVNFNGTVSPVLNSTTVPQFGYITINNTGGISPSVGWNILYSLAVGSGASFNGGTSTHNILGGVTNNGTITSAGTLNFLPSLAATVNLGSNFSSTGTVVFGGAGAMTLAGTPVSFNNVVIANTNGAGITPSSDWTLTKNFTVNSGSTFNAGNRSFSVRGNILNNGTINSGNSNFILNGTDRQDISTLSSFKNLTLNKASGSANISSNTTVSGILSFVSGIIETGSYTLIQPSSGTVSGAAQNTGWVNGRLRKNIATASTTKLFEIGDASSYTPLSLVFSSVSAAGDMVAFTTAGDHPNISSSMINIDRSVNRFWTLTNSGVAFSDYTALFNFVASDIDAGATPSSFEVGFYDGSSWVLPGTASSNATNAQVAGVTATGDFAIGEVCYKGTSIFYPASPYCSNTGSANVTLTGSSGGTYSSTAGLSINASTGSINLSSSIPGAYLVTYTIAATSGCRSYSASSNIIITGAASAIVSYAGSPHCSGGGMASVTFSGTAGGTYSSTAGLSINTTTGDINTALSAAGTYTVTYTVAGTGGCGQYQTTASVTISNPPSAVISYSGNPYCSSAGDTITITQTGTAGGVYSSTPGLSINAATGSIIAGTSTEGDYIVTYTIAAANGCAPFTTTASVSVNALPSATISYGGSPFCNLTGTVAVTLTGTEGGTFGSTAGLAIDAGSGDINTGTSTPGIYTVVYTVSANTGCAEYSITTSVAIAIPGTWSGDLNDDWDNGENWLCGAIPSITTNVTIPGSLPNYPVVSQGAALVHNITIESGASLVITGATLRIAGTISNNGTLTATAGTIEMSGSGAQDIPAGTFSGDGVKGLVINNTAGVTLNGTLFLSDVLTISAGTLNTGGHLTLKSTATTTARVAAITSNAANPINGNVTVQQYFGGKRKYRLVTSSVTTKETASLIAGEENLSIWGNWQNQGINTNPNMGNFITGGTSADGFDTQTPGASLFTYNDVSRSYTGFTSANGKNTKYSPLKAGVGYYMFIYGDRRNTITTSSPNSTILTATGSLLTGTQAYTTNSSIPLSGITGRYTLLGNPFASPVDWTTIPRSGIADTYWGWDPNLSSTGGYVTVTTLGHTVITSPQSGVVTLNQYIQPGQGFFVKTSGPAPLLTIREQDKTTDVNNNGARSELAALPMLAVNLQYNNGASRVLADGAVAVFDDAFSNLVQQEDASKMLNTGEGLALINTGQLLSIEGRKLPQSNDTIFLNVSGLSKTQYTLEVFTTEMQGVSIYPCLLDKYLNTVQPLMLNDTNRVDFAVNASVPASFNTSRFLIVFKSDAELGLKFMKVKASAKNRNILVQWDIDDENGIIHYDVERSSDGVNFEKKGQVPAKENNSYDWMDSQPAEGYNYYRIRAIKTDGRNSLSNVVSVKMKVNGGVLSVNPNPVQHSKINFKITMAEKGKYTVTILDYRGQGIFKQHIQHSGGALNRSVRFDQVAPGVYYLEVKNQNTRYVNKIIIE